MKAIKIAGLGLFIMGFTIFNISFFWSNYTVTDDILTQKITNADKAALVIAELESRDFSSSFTLLSQLTNTFEEINVAQIERYTITLEEIDRIVAANPGSFSIATINTLFVGDEGVIQFKQKAFQDYGSWLENQQVNRSQIESVADNIRKFAIVNKFGFDRYASKELLYSITKASAQGPIKNFPLLFFLLTVGLSIVGAMLYILPKLQLPAGIKNNGIFFNPLKNTGWLGILVGTWLIVFYVALYFYPEYMTHWIIMVDPLSEVLNGGEAGRFFLYGLLYTLCILVMGIRMLIHYRHSKYQILRTLSVMFFQTAFAFLIPEIMVRLNQPYFDFKNIWPLDYSFFFDYRLNEMMANGTLGIFMLVWGIVLIIIAVPVMVYFFGKRWYCSWVCGCGGLAETLGDPYRQLSNKTVKAWKVERWMIHGVLVFAIVMTGGVLYTYFTGSAWVFFFDSYQVREAYGAFIGAGFAGVVGTGFYPLMGNRVWCRFGCPLAAYLGLVQRFKSRFRITTNGGQCISCGNCSTYCEMGIDVRWYAQRGQNIVRSSCVGCGVCSSVCPRGVLNLEVKGEEGRFGNPILIGNNGIELAD